MNRKYIISLVVKPGIAIITMCCIIAFAGVSFAASEDPFVNLAETALSFFVPMEGYVTSTSNGTLTSDLGQDDGIREGMRLDITRKGTPFVHPVTKEKLGLMESPVGRAEVVEAGPNSSTLRVINGEPAEGDILRLSSALVRTLFFQSSEVDWNVSEEYYDTLRSADRFNLIDTAPGMLQDAMIVEEARRLGAEVALVLTSSKSDEGMILNQRLLWTEDSEEFSRMSEKVDAELLADLRLGSELFTPVREHVISFDVPYSTSLTEAADIDGDGVRELILGTSSTLSFHKTDGPLNRAFGELEYNGPKSEEIIWLDAYDLDGDGKDELVITSRTSSRVVSRIYKYKDGALAKELEGNHFLRVIDGRLYGQRFDKNRGYSGPLFPVSWGALKEASETGMTELPPGVNIFDFSFIESPEGEKWTVAFDDYGYLNLYTAEGTRVWRSKKGYGEGVKSYEKESNRSVVDIRSDDEDTTIRSLEEWTVNDKIHVMGRSAIVIDRILVSTKAPGIGVKRSQIVGLRWTGPSFEESPLFKDISGNVRDISIIGDRVYILARPPMGFDFKRLFKGKSPTINKLYVYSLKGM
jgi:hypothetical protein